MYAPKPTKNTKMDSTLLPEIQALFSFCILWMQVCGFPLVIDLFFAVSWLKCTPMIQVHSQPS